METAKQKLQEAIAVQSTNLEGAVELFGQALQECVAVAGEVSPVCAEYYLRYGAALFELAQQNTTVLGEHVEEETRTVKAPPAIASAAPSVLAAKPLGVPETLKADVENDDKAENGEEKNDGAEDGDDAGGPDEDQDAASEEEEGADDEEAAAEEGDIQIAWELLDTARVIYEGQQSSEVASPLAEVYLNLADISNLKEQYDAAVQDYLTCIRTLQQITPTKARRLAEAHYKLSLCLLQAERLPESLKHCTEAANLIAARQDELEQELAAAESAAHSNETSDKKDQEALKREMQDLDAITKELKTQAEDIEASMKNRDSVKAAIVSALAYAVRPAAAADNAGQTSGAGQQSGAALGTALPSAGSNAARPAPQVLGVVGRGKSRITLAPVPTDGTGSSAGASGTAVNISALGSAAPLTLPKGKRSLEDLLSGSAAAGNGAAVGSEPVAVKQAKPSD